MAIVNPRLPLEAAPRPFTAADLAEMPRELPSGPVHYELDNGRIVAMSPPGHIHGKVEVKIAYALVEAGEKQGHGEVSGGETGVLLWRNPDRVVGADVVFLRAAALPARLTKEGYLETIPDLVVEVVSKNDTAPYVQRKVDDYLTAGVRVVWVADPDSRILTEHRRDAKPRVYAENETAAVPELIPGLQLSLKDVFDF
ncbi:MAG TPA: Uma2 family endonuclease [Pirellulales bacterium]|nr:Uma2 family endonuclease [Pirellulales bacterium]